MGNWISVKNIKGIQMNPEQEEYFKKLAIETAAKQGNAPIDPKLLEHVNKIRFKQPHWKESQSEDSKQLALARAEAKRLRKQRITTNA